MSRANAIEAAGLAVFAVAGACVVYGVSQLAGWAAWILAGVLLAMVGAVAVRLANGGVA